MLMRFLYFRALLHNIRIFHIFLTVVLVMLTSNETHNSITTLPHNFMLSQQS
jgi:hypothetical protein